MTVALRLAEFLVASSATDLPPQALEHAAMQIASTIASAAPGAGLESARIIRELACERGGRPDSTLWFAGHKLPMADAAQVNAVMSDAAASDDSDLRNIVHAGTPLTAASLAVAEHRGASGAAVLTAMVLGYEAAGRISAAITPGFRERGFHGCLGAKGAGALGIAWSDVDAKYRTLVPASGLPATAIEASLALIHAFGQAADVTGLVGMLRVAGG